MVQNNTKRYYSLIESLISDQQQIWGDQAIEMADSIPGLHVSGADDIWVNGNEKRIAGKLTEAYVAKFGQAAESSLRETADAYRDEVELPPVLR